MIELKKTVDQNMSSLSTRMEHNREVLEDIRNAQIAGKALNTAGKWLAGVLLGLLSLWAGLKGLKG